MRPLTAALAVLAATQGGASTLRGVPRMHERPIGDLVDALRPLGCTVDDLGQPGYPPLRGAAAGRRPAATSRPIRVRGDVSSQFLTALLLALPLVRRTGPVVIEVDGELISKPYIEITLNLLARFGIDVQRDGWRRFTIPQAAAIARPGAIHVEGDASSASYFVALGAIAAHGGAPVRIEGVGLDSIQGDIRFVEAARAMGAEVRGGPGWLEVQRGRWPLRAITLDCNHIPDAAMTLAVMALYADGTTPPDRHRQLAREGDRPHRRDGRRAAQGRRRGGRRRDFIEVTPPAPGLAAAAIHTYDDHRMAMCLSLAAFNPLAGARRARAPVRILDPKLRGQDLPRLLRGPVRLAQADAADMPVITIDGPTASGKGTLAAPWRAPGLAPAGFRRAVPRHRPGGQRQGVALTTSRAGPPGRGAGPALRRRARPAATARREHRTARRAPGCWPRASRPWPGRARGAARPATGVPARCRAGGRRARHGHRGLPARRSRCFSPPAPRVRAERRYKQLISKGIQASIADLRADIEARDERDRSRPSRP
jgi:3-phosphoshikimate 1-carboxyvinyltransferase